MLHNIQQVIDALSLGICANNRLLKPEEEKQLETRTRAGVVMLGILSLIVLSTLTLALAAPETGGSANRVAYEYGEDVGHDAEDWSQYRADAGHSGYAASQLPSDRSTLCKWEGKTPSGLIVLPIARTCDVW